MLSGKGQKLIAIYCRPDHTHILLGLKPNIAPSDLIGDIKTGSTNHVNEQEWIGCRFSWQALAQNKKIWPPPPKYPSQKSFFFQVEVKSLLFLLGTPALRREPPRRRSRVCG